MNKSITQWLEKYPQSTVEEMRAIRRQLINDITTMGMRLSTLKKFVRRLESSRYGQELRVY